MRGPRPRSFEEVVIAQDPTERARLARGEHFTDPSVSPFHGEVRLTKIATVRVSGVLSILTMTAVATSRFLPVLRPRGGRAITSHLSNLVGSRFRENPSRSSFSAQGWPACDKIPKRTAEAPKKSCYADALRRSP
jgi:hypothetical protein